MHFPFLLPAVAYIHIYITLTPPILVTAHSCSPWHTLTHFLAAPIISFPLLQTPWLLHVTCHLLYLAAHDSPQKETAAVRHASRVCQPPAWLHGCDSQLWSCSSTYQDTHVLSIRSHRHAWLRYSLVGIVLCCAVDACSRAPERQLSRRHPAFLLHVSMPASLRYLLMYCCSTAHYLNLHLDIFCMQETRWMYHRSSSNPSSHHQPIL